MVVDIPLAFGVTLRKIRNQRKISQEAFGAELGLHRTHVSLLERGKRDPLLSTVYQISRRMGISLPELMTLVDDEIKSQSEKT